MHEGRERPFVSVKFTPVGRTYTFLLPDLALDSEAPRESPETDEPRIADHGTRIARISSGAEDADGAESAPDTVPTSRPVFSPGDAVVVNTIEGPAVGTVMRAIPDVAARKRPAADSSDRVVRKATRDDIVTRLKHQQREQDAQRICLMKIRERGLSMKLARVEQIFDGSRLIFYYTAEGRVDFRELVRDLAAHFRARIEMRQIGVRDEAKMLGGYGSCGRPLCCTTWLQSFEPVSIKMAKQQKLSLNPSKLSGMCGRLKCCLRYELPNGKGVKHGGCADEGGCGSCDNPTGPGGGCGSCGSGGCGSCGH
jgi:cell fate regulator YaaT (PSP1 superfamily)